MPRAVTRRDTAASDAWASVGARAGAGGGVHPWGQEAGLQLPRPHEFSIRRAAMNAQCEPTPEVAGGLEVNTQINVKLPLKLQVPKRLRTDQLEILQKFCRCGAL